MIRLKDILLEDEASNAFGKWAFTDPTRQSDCSAKKFVDAQGGDFERDSDKEYQIYHILTQWVINPDSYVSSTLFQYKDLLQKAKKRYPKIFKPDSSGDPYVYRGLKLPSRQIVNLVNSSTQKDWKKAGDTELWVYHTPTAYTPRSPIQSWTTSTTIARKFAEKAPNYDNSLPETILRTALTDDFIFNQTVFKILYGGSNEYETLHFGLDYDAPVELCITTDTYENEINIGKHAKA